LNSRTMQIRIWELANEYGMDSEEVRKALSAAGLHRPSAASLVPDAEARGVLGRPGRPGRNPFMRKRPARDRDQRSDVLSEAAEMFGVDERSLKLRRDDMRQPKQPKQRAAGPPSQPKRELTDWDREFIEPAEAMEWRDHGVYDARVAIKAKQLGLGPRDMKIKLDGVQICQRLANGESVASVRSRLRERGAESG
jgi:hypothetical protein